MSLRHWSIIGVLTVVVAATPSGAAAAAFGEVVDLGQNVVPYGAPAVVAGQDVVPVANGLWENATVTTPMAPSADPTGAFIPAAVNGSGVVVGEARTGLGAYVPAYWDSQHSPSFVEVSLSGLMVNGKAASTGELVSVDSTGEAVGFVENATAATNADFAGLSVAGSGGLPAGTTQVVTSLGSVTVHNLASISSGWESGAASGSPRNTFFSYNRQTGTTSTSTLIGVESAPGGFADNGLIAGTDMTSFAAEAFNPAGSSTTLQGTGPSPYAINASGVIVGVQRTAPTNIGTTWSAASGADTPLLSEVSSNTPGFTALYPTGIDDGDDIVGTGVIGSQTHGFLARVKQLVPPVVTSTGDSAASDPSSGSCDTGRTVADSTGAQVPECTLRAAIQAVNAIGRSSQKITFDIPSSALAAIKLNSALPAITAAGTTVDGTTESGGSIDLDGTKLAGTGSCLTAQASGVVLRGLRLANCPTGIELAAPGSDKVVGDVVGLAADGATAASGRYGVAVDAGSAGDIIGGTAVTDRDVISAQGTGILLAAGGATVQGDLLGTDLTGHVFVPDQIGVLVGGQSTGDTIGGTATTAGAPPGNVIVAGSASSTFNYGVITLGGSATIAGNLIGTDASGTALYAPSSGHAAAAGVLVAGPTANVVVGGAGGAGNVIAGGSLAQVEIDGAGSVKTKVLGNRLGAGSTGGVLATPKAAGVLDAGASGAIIGASGAGNAITGQQVGVLIAKESREIDFSTTEIVDGQPTVQYYAVAGTNVSAKMTAATVTDNVIGPLPGGESIPGSAEQVGVLDAGGSNDRIGPRNVISWNGVGVDLDGTLESGTEGNLIGTDAGGLEALPNGIGVKVEDGANKTPIGVTGTPDTISGNLLGVYLDSGATIVHGELIGTTSRGNALLKPFKGRLPVEISAGTHSIADGGIDVDKHAHATLIGGPDKGDGVTVSGTDGDGIRVRSLTRMYAVRVGVAAHARTALPNQGDGVDIDTAGKATLFGAGIVAHNRGVGIRVAGQRDAMIVETPIYDNTKGGLEIHSRDVPRAPDVRHAINKNGRTALSAEINVPRGDGADLEYFATPSCEAHGGGEKLLHRDDHVGRGRHLVQTDVPIEPVGTAITALITVSHGSHLTQELEDKDAPDGATSLFSACREVKPS